jgi:hypothetical protein
MYEFFSREPDSIEAILRPPLPTDNETLRQAVYTRTQRVLHRRRRLRQWAYAASLLMSFVAGASAMHIVLLGEWSVLPGERDRVSAPRDALEALTQPRSPDSEALTQPRSPDSALEAEWVAFDSTERRSELYRQAGDRYMKEEKDLESALRCYRNALNNGTEQDLAISPDDNWLLMAIKNARQKEKKYAKQGS